MSTAVSSKIASIVSMRTTDAALLSALQHVSALDTDKDGLLDGDQLRGRIEARDVELNEQLLAEFARVQQQLDSLDATVGGLVSW